MGSPASDIVRVSRQFPEEFREHVSACAEALRTALGCELWHLDADTSIAEMLEWSQHADMAHIEVFTALEENLELKWDGDRSENADAVTFRELIEWMMRAKKSRRRIGKR